MAAWYSLQLGDALTAQLALEHIRESFEARYPAAGRPADAALYVRHDTSGGLHCQVTAFFPSAVEDLARELGATPCNAPPLDGLERLDGERRALRPPIDAPAP
jgi:hypothetical protein